MATGSPGFLPLATPLPFSPNRNRGFGAEAGNGDKLLSRLADQFAAGDVLTYAGADGAAHHLLEAAWSLSMRRAAYIALQGLHRGR